MFTSNKRMTHELSFWYMCEIQKIFFVWQAIFKDPNQCKLSRKIAKQQGKFKGFLEQKLEHWTTRSFENDIEIKDKNLLMPNSMAQNPHLSSENLKLSV